MAKPDTIAVEVVLALPDRQALRSLELPAGSTVRDALDASGLAADFPEVAIDPGRVGVFGRLRPAGHVLQSGDRVEIYRPLKVDPREARRERASGRPADRKSDT